MEGFYTTAAEEARFSTQERFRNSLSGIATKSLICILVRQRLISSAWSMDL
jgi:hypothetical protein